MAILGDRPAATAAPATSPPVTGSATVARKAKAIKWWAAVGAVFLVVQAYVLIAWVASGQAVPTPTGPDPIPTYTKVAIRSMEIVLPIFALALVWFFLVRPWIRERRLTTDGMLLIGWVSLYFLQDTMLNYSQTWFLYNSYQLNLGSWNSQIPGWISPGGHLLPEPVLIWMPGYVIFCFVPCVLGCKFLNWLKGRRPELGKVGSIGILYAIMVVYDFVFEVWFLRLDTYAYAGSIRSLTLWAGQTYQFPIYEALFAAWWYTIITALRFYRDDRGRTFVERGVETINAGPRRKQGLKFLAIIGLFHIMGLAYNIPMQFMALHADPFPQGYESWMLNGMCGPGSPYECPGPGVDIARADRPYPADTPYNVKLKLGK
jgi:hypothetical protein